MKLRELAVKNFRNLVDVRIPVADTTVLVGENNAGKTAMLDALGVALPRTAFGSQQGLLRCWIKRAESAPLNDAARKIIASAVKHLGGGSEFLRFSADAIGWFDILAGRTNGQQEEVFARYVEEPQVWESLVQEITRSCTADGARSRRGFCVKWGCLKADSG